MANKYSGPQYSTKLFTDVWGQVSDFLTDYQESGIPTSIATTGTASATTLYYLLYARHGNDPIANLDEYQWKTKLFAVIFQYGPTWVKEMALQETVRNMTTSEIESGSYMIFNHALNPETSPSTSAETELTYINEQNTNRYKKAKVDAYAQYDMILKADVTSNFLKKFDALFKRFVYDELPIIYDTEVNDD